MLTEKGAIRTSAKYDDKLYRQLNRYSIIMCSCLFAAGTLLLVAVVTFGLLTGQGVDIMLLLCSILIIICSVILLTFSIVTIIKSKNCEKHNVIEMYADYMIVHEFLKGEKIAEARVDYKTLFRCRETRDFFLAYVNRAALHPISKEGLSPAELNTVRRILGLKANITSDAELAPVNEIAASEPKFSDNKVFEEFPEPKDGEDKI